MNLKIIILYLTILFYSKHTFAQTLNNTSQENMMEISRSNSKTIVFIHGLFMNPMSWEPWIEFFEEQGYTCYAPAYPYHEGIPSELRENIDPNLSKLDISEVVESYISFIDDLPEKPILIGHSMGGLVSQKLLELEKGVAAICISSAPPSGILSFKRSFWKANFPVINPFKGKSVFMPTEKWFHYAFCNTMTLEEASKEYKEFAVPESRNVPKSVLTNNYGKINFKEAHQPILFISGDKDNIIPVSLNKKNFKAYKDEASVKSHKIFENRTHYICRQENWQEVASYVYNWIQDIGKK